MMETKGYCYSEQVSHRVRFIFLHTPLLEPQGWQEAV